jgi:mannosyltransferase OCH1-like enzyme
MIPKIIHQTYKSTELPPVYRQCQESVLKLHPDFEYRFYTDADMDRIVREEAPEYYKAFSALPRMIMKIDMFRYFLMYLYGGLYVDMDYMMLRRFDLLEEEVVLPCSREDGWGVVQRIGNCVFASRAGHPFWRGLMDTLFTIDRTVNMVDSGVDQAVTGTGPGFVTDMWQRYVDKQTIYVPRKLMFHPPSNTARDILFDMKSYGIHFCAGLWRDGAL